MTKRMNPTWWWKLARILFKNVKRCLLPLPKVLSWDDLRCPKDSQTPNIKIFGQGVKFNQTMTTYGGLMYFSHNKSNQKALKIELEEVLEPTCATFYATACICCVGNACVAYVLQWIRSSRFSSPVSVVGAYLGMSWYHTQVDLPHIRHFRRIQAHWQAYDAYARVCMAMGTNQSLGRWATFLEWSMASSGNTDVGWTWLAQYARRKNLQKCEEWNDNNENNKL